MNAATDTAAEKQLVAEHAAELVADGMTVGLGTGSTVNPMLHALAARKLEIRCVATSGETERLARDLGLPIEPFDELDRLDLAIDGADQVAPDGWLVKGGGGAHTREKIVAAAADRFVVIVDSMKPVERIRAPIPLELAAFGLNSTLRELGAVQLRDAARSSDDGVIADYVGEVNEPERIADWLASVPGVIEHGLFGPGLVSEVLVGRGDEVELAFTRESREH